jgi:hypothetical protein
VIRESVSPHLTYHWRQQLQSSADRYLQVQEELSQTTRVSDTLVSCILYLGKTLFIVAVISIDLAIVIVPVASVIRRKRVGDRLLMVKPILKIIY